MKKFTWFGLIMTVLSLLLVSCSNVANSDGTDGPMVYKGKYNTMDLTLTLTPPPTGISDGYTFTLTGLTGGNKAGTATRIEDLSSGMKKYTLTDATASDWSGEISFTIDGNIQIKLPISLNPINQDRILYRQ